MPVIAITLTKTKIINENTNLLWITSICFNIIKKTSIWRPCSVDLYSALDFVIFTGPSLCMSGSYSCYNTKVNTFHRPFIAHNVPQRGNWQKKREAALRAIVSRRDRVWVSKWFSGEFSSISHSCHGLLVFFSYVGLQLLNMFRLVTTLATGFKMLMRICVQRSTKGLWNN